MSQLLAVLPPYVPSRRNLFTKSNLNAATDVEEVTKRLRKNSGGEFYSVSADTKDNTEPNPQDIRKGNYFVLIIKFFVAILK